MRISRSVQLFKSAGFVHKFWRCHNREYYLNNSFIKQLYLNCIIKALKPENSEGNISIHAFCAMTNHFHHLIYYKNGSQWLSSFMRFAHGVFGAKYNRLNNRSGKVAEGRPKTPLIQNIEHLIKVHFYIEANPIRAGLTKLENLHTYKFCTYKLYAFGRQDETNRHVEIPQWYIDLGATNLIRQQKYRALFRKYLTQQNSLDISIFFQNFIGSMLWVKEQTDRIRHAPQANCTSKNTIPLNSS